MTKQVNRRLRRKVRGSYAISTVSVALVLFLLGGVGYLIMNIRLATDRMREKVTLYVMMNDNVSAERSAAVGETLRGKDGVREAIFVTKDAAAAEFAAFSGEDFETFLQFNPLPDSYEVRLKATASAREQIEALVKEFEQIEGVGEVVYQKSVIDSIGANLRKFYIVLVIFGAALLVISLILLRNTIRMSVFSKRYLINTMKLVGATRGFIKRPFLKDAFWQGIVAALLAALLFCAMVYGLNEGLPYVMLITGARPLIAVVGGMLALGALISVVFTDLSLNKFIKMNTTKIYLY